MKQYLSENIHFARSPVVIEVPDAADPACTVVYLFNGETLIFKKRYEDNESDNCTSTRQRWPLTLAEATGPPLPRVSV